MRAVLATTAAAIALSLSGCDTNTGTPAARVSCNCAAAPVAVPGMRGSAAFAPVATPHHTHHRFGGAARWTSHSYYWRREFAEVSVQTYGYHSDSHSYYASASGGHDGGGGRTESGWQDGHGRWHAMAGAATHADETRLQSWHGYDADCPDRTRR